MSGFSSACVIITEANFWRQRYLNLVFVPADPLQILVHERRERWLMNAHPSLIPSSIFVGATCSPNPMTGLAICLMLITYLSAPFCPCSAPAELTERAAAASSSFTGIILCNAPLAGNASFPTAAYLPPGPANRGLLSPYQIPSHLNTDWVVRFWIE